jgi:hypothetical protein
VLRLFAWPIRRANRRDPGIAGRRRPPSTSSWWGSRLVWKAGDRRVILMGGGQSAAEADTEVRRGRPQLPTKTVMTKSDGGPIATLNPVRPKFKTAWRGFVGHDPRPPKRDYTRRGTARWLCPPIRYRRPLSSSGSGAPAGSIWPRWPA